MIKAIEIGPALRGLSFDGHQGARFHYVESYPKESGDIPLVLEDADDLDAVATRYNAYVKTVGFHPRRIALADGSSWIRDAGADAAGTPAAADPGNQTPAGASGDVATAAGSAPAVAPLTRGALADAVVGKVVLVTGAAQGFGWELARGFAGLGAVVVLADMNLDGVRGKAAQLGDPHCAFGVNVTDEESVKALVTDVTRAFGGIDVLVSNAGVLRAGSVQSLSIAAFRFVTDVNYIGFFLMVKHVSPIMGRQFRAAAAVSAVPYFTDIIEINSKSGLVGSNKNGAYAGSKFGGIGLVQSFALELIEEGIKVNAVCPGNFLDGPLWSDPDRGLFVQYLRAGKVPGAETIADVRRFYEAKVPMKRGCYGADVLRALVYTIGQVYETGQAIPVTGGQVMLS